MLLPEIKRNVPRAALMAKAVAALFLARMYLSILTLERGPITILVRSENNNCTRPVNPVLIVSPSNTELPVESLFLPVEPEELAEPLTLTALPTAVAAVAGKVEVKAKVRERTKLTTKNLIWDILVHR